MTKMFDPAVMAQMTFSNANSTEFVPFPAGDHDFVILESKIELWSSQEKGTSGLKLVMKVDPIDADGKIKEETGRDKNELKYEIMLDTTDDGSGLDFGKGKNVRLGRLREYCDLNKPGQDFNFNMFAGKMVRLTIKHGVYKGEPIANVDGLVPKAA